MHMKDEPMPVDDGLDNERAKPVAVTGIKPTGRIHLVNHRQHPAGAGSGPDASSLLFHRRLSRIDDYS